MWVTVAVVAGTSCSNKDQLSPWSSRLAQHNDRTKLRQRCVKELMALTGAALATPTLKSAMVMRLKIIVITRVDRIDVSLRYPDISWSDDHGSSIALLRVTAISQHASWLSMAS